MKAREETLGGWGILQKNNINTGGALREGGKSGKEHIPPTQAVVLNEGEVRRRSQSLAGGGARVFNHFRDGPEGLYGVSGSRPWPVGAGWGPLGGAWVSLDWRMGLGVERSLARVGGASGVEGAGRRLSATFIAPSLSEEASDSSSSEGAGA